MRFYLDNKPMRQVMTEQELYDAKESSFWLAMPGENRMQAMMYIANFSERVVDIVVEDGTTPTPTPTITQAAKTPVSTPTTPGFGFILDCWVRVLLINWDGNGEQVSYVIQEAQLHPEFTLESSLTLLY